MKIALNGWNWLDWLTRAGMAEDDWRWLETDTQNVPSKQCCSGKFLLAWVNFWSEYARFSPANGKNIITLYQAARGKLILGWLTFPGLVTLPSLGIVTQTDVVYLRKG